MRHVFKRSMVFLAVLGFVSVISGCTDWEKEHAGLEVEHANTKGRLERSEELRSESEQLNRRLQESLIRAERELRDFQEMPVAPGDSVIWEVDEDKWTITATLPNEILFSAGSAELKKGTIKELEEVYSVLRSRYGDKDISIVGHTDSDPITKSGWKDNWQLSSERSLSVVRYLVNKGMPKSQIKATGVGEHRPLAKNNTVAGKAKNRRVEFVVHML